MVLFQEQLDEPPKTRRATGTSKENEEYKPYRGWTDMEEKTGGEGGSSLDKLLDRLRLAK